jgi:hypothetical protein
VAVKKGVHDVRFHGDDFAHARSRKPFRTTGIITIVVGIVFAVVGAVAYVMVSQTLADQRIVVADDVDGPFSAYARAIVIGKHAEDIGGQDLRGAAAGRPRPRVGDDGLVPAGEPVHVGGRLRLGGDGLVLGIVLALIGRVMMQVTRE